MREEVTQVSDRIGSSNRDPSSLRGDLGDALGTSGFGGDTVRNYLRVICSNARQTGQLMC